MISWLRANLFSSIPSTIISLLLIFLLAKACVSFVQWGIAQCGLDACPRNDTSACRALRGLGACWAVIPEKYRFILFGTYPFDQQWRPALATLIVRRAVPCIEPAQLLAQGAGIGLGGRADR